MALNKTIVTVSVTSLLLLTQVCAEAADVVVSALFNGKAVLIIDGGKPRTVSSGQMTPEGVKLISASSESAVIEHGGQRQTLSLGHGTRIGAAPGNSGAGQVTLNADIRGHFVTTGAVNGVAVRFLVDTGASSVAFSTAEAKRLGINYLAGTRGLSSTANGTVQVYRVKLDTVRVGDITLTNVDADIVDGAGLNIALLGMSFLNRMQMKRDGDTLTLVRRY